MIKIENDAKIVHDDLMFIYDNYYLSSGMVSQCKYPSYDEKTKVIGNSKYRISRKNYTEDFIKIGTEGMYFFQLIDESLISLWYKFDASDKIEQFEISFIPSYESDILFKNRDDFGVLSKYIRIDYDKEGYKEIIHPKIHMHNNLERDGLRIPLDNIVYPSEFLFLILRYYYDFEWKQLSDYLDLAIYDCGVLNDDEKNLFFLSISGK